MTRDDGYTPFVGRRSSVPELILVQRLWRVQKPLRDAALDGYQGDALTTLAQFHAAQRPAWRRAFLVRANARLDAMVARRDVADRPIATSEDVVVH